MSDYVGEIKIRSAEERERDSAAEAAALIAKGQAGQAKKVGKGLVEPQTANVDSGQYVGDPEHQERLRAVEIMGAHGTGTVKIKIKGPDGKVGKFPKEVPATVANLTEALRQAKLGTPKLPASIRAKAQKVETLTRWLKAAQMRPLASRELTVPQPADGGSQRSRRGAQREGRDVRAVQTRAPKAGAAKGGRDHGSVDGVALVRGRMMPPVEPARVNARGGAKNAAGWGDSLGRERSDAAAVIGAALATEHDAENDPECKARQCVHFFGASQEARKGRYTHGQAFPMGMTWSDYSGLSETQQKAAWKWDGKQRKRESRARAAEAASAQWERQRVIEERRRMENAIINAGDNLDVAAVDGEWIDREGTRELMAKDGVRGDKGVSVGAELKVIRRRDSRIKGK